MPLTKLDLANLMLEKIKADHPLIHYLRVRNIATEPGDISIANLIYHMDCYYEGATTVKSAILFLTEDVGVKAEQCILVVCVPDQILYLKVAKAISENNGQFLIARAESFDEAKTLANYFNLGNLSCGLVTAFEINGESCYDLMEHVTAASTKLPVMVIGNRISLSRNHELRANGAGSVIDTDHAKTLDSNLLDGVERMFLA